MEGIGIWAFMGGCLSIAIIISFFIMASNVAKAKEYAIKQYQIMVQIGLKNGVDIEKIKEIDDPDYIYKKRLEKSKK